MKKVFIGTVDITSRIRDFDNLFKSMGVETMTAKESHSNRYNSPVDYIFEDYYTYYFRGVRPTSLQKLLKEKFGIRKRIFKKALKECDTFLYIWSPFYQDFSDYKILKEHGKKIITCFVGSDVRWGKAAQLEFNSYKMNFPEILETDLDSLSRKLKYVKIAEKYSDMIFSRPDQSQLLTKPYFRFLPYINLNDFNQIEEQKPIPSILHAPSKNPIKGSQHVLKVIEELKDEGVKFNFNFVQNLSQKEVRELMAKTDIVIEKVLLLEKQGGKNDFKRTK